jgi:glyceraldehyde-3-phosphate dehydrogenase/erythrose-4-phosphate dehydrogenase
MPTKIAINGFGRTGRIFFRATLHEVSNYRDAE